MSNGCDLSGDVGRLKVLICGSRTSIDQRVTDSVVARLPADSIVVHGDARGADRMAGYAAVRQGLEVHAYPADWEHYGKRAGPIRNQQMLEIEKPDLVIYFCVDGSNPTRGTADMINRAKRAGVKTLHWTEIKSDLVQQQGTRLGLPNWVSQADENSAL